MKRFKSFLMFSLGSRHALFGCRLLAKGTLTVGDFVLLQAYVINRSVPLGFDLNIRRIYQNLADAEEMTVILNTPPGSMDVTGAKVLKMTESKLNLKELILIITKPMKCFPGLI